MNTNDILQSVGTEELMAIGFEQLSGKYLSLRVGKNHNILYHESDSSFYLESDRDVIDGDSLKLNVTSIEGLKYLLSVLEVTEEIIKNKKV